jgi:predicted HAD superfamily Cof-like phosphohydrolase
MALKFFIINRYTNYRILNNVKNHTMQKQLEAVKLFHTTYGLGISENMKADLGTQKNNLRFDLMKEENEEYLEAVQNNDIVEIADALGDMLYILCGTILEHGLQHKIEAVFDEIQRSNMSKLGEDGKPIYREDGKVMKGPNYFKPNFEAILK